MFRRLSWFGSSSSSLWKPKNPHSTEYLKYLHTILVKNQTVTESNKNLLVEALRSIAEILIWGDQNDPGVFDFFLEKQMLSFFLKIMKQSTCGSYVCVQLLQTLNILFENIKNQTSIYYLLSNNHVNSIIEHKFDFSDEEVMAYYISFLKTLSLKLNGQTIHFFYNEHTHDFPLYTEAIKFFNHPESMVRIAVRTLTLNVFKVEDKSMQQFIRDKTAAPYFSNLVWFIRDHVVEQIDKVVKEMSQGDSEDESTSPFQRQAQLTTHLHEHLDHLTYLNDILLLGNPSLVNILVDHLLNQLIKPVVIVSLSKASSPQQQQKVSRVLALYVLRQIFKIIEDEVLLEQVLVAMEKDNVDFLELLDCREQGDYVGFYSVGVVREILTYLDKGNTKDVSKIASSYLTDKKARIMEAEVHASETTLSTEAKTSPSKDCVVTMETDEQQPARTSVSATTSLTNAEDSVAGQNSVGIKSSSIIPITTLLTSPPSLTILNTHLLSHILTQAPTTNNVRLCTVAMTTSIINHLSKTAPITDLQLALLLSALESTMATLRTYFKTEEMFLEMFEDEYNKSLGRYENRDDDDACMLLPPVGSPLSGVKELERRRPCGETERCRYYLRLFFHLRSLHLNLTSTTEKYLPLTNLHKHSTPQLEQVIDLTNSDLLACTIIATIAKETTKLRRFLVVDTFHIILVDPSPKRMGWGVVKFVGYLQDMDVQPDPSGSDPRCLQITVKSGPVKPKVISKLIQQPLLCAKFVFDDHIRCMAARQRLLKGRSRARDRKLTLISRYLLNEEPPSSSSSKYSPPTNLRSNTNAKDQVHQRYQPIARTLPGLAVVSVEASSSRRSSSPSRNEKSGTGSLSPRTFMRKNAKRDSNLDEIPLEKKKPEAVSNQQISSPTEEGANMATTSFCLVGSKGKVYDV